MLLVVEKCHMAEVLVLFQTRVPTDFGKVEFCVILLAEKATTCSAQFATSLAQIYCDTAWVGYGKGGCCSCGSGIA